MKLYILILLVGLFSLNKTGAQNREFSFQVNIGRATDTSSASVILSKSQKPVLAFIADLTRSASRFDLTIKDEEGSPKVKSLFYILNNQLIQWQLTDRTKPDQITETKGEIQLLKRVQ